MLATYEWRSKVKLDEYLQETSTSAEKFSREKDIPVSSVRRTLRGHTPSARTAVRIVDATNGEVTFDDLLRSAEGSNA